MESLSARFGENAVSFCQLRLDRKAMRDAIRGQEGITEIARQNLRDGKYVDALGALWSELSFKNRLEWMREAAEALHAPFMFELAIAEFVAVTGKDKGTGADLYSNQRKIEVLNTITLPLFKAASFLTHQAAQCASDPSVSNGDACARMEMVYFQVLKTVITDKTTLNPNILSQSNQERKSAVIRKVAEVANKSLTIKLPNPTWVAHSGMATFLGGIKMRPEDQWDRLRKDFAAQNMQ